MPSFGIPSAAERWGLAALVLSFRHDDLAIARGRALAMTGVATSWTDLADRSDAELIAALRGRGVPAAGAEDLVAYLRAEVAFAPVGGSLADVRAHLATALDEHAARRSGRARAHVTQARRALRDRLVAITAADRTLAARLDEQLARLSALAATGALDETLAHEVVRTQALLDRGQAARASVTPADGAGLALERCAVALIALGLVLAAIRGRRGAALAATAGMIAGGGLGLALSAESRSSALALAGSLFALVVAQAAGAPRARALALAVMPGLAIGAVVRGLAPVGVGTAAAAGAVAGVGAVALIAAVAWLARRAGDTAADIAVVVVTGVTMGQLAWLAWVLAEPTGKLRPWPRIAALGFYPIVQAPLALAAGVVIAGATLLLTVSRRGRRPRPRVPLLSGPP